MVAVIIEGRHYDTVIIDDIVDEISAASTHDYPSYWVLAAPPEALDVDMFPYLVLAPKFNFVASTDPPKQHTFYAKGIKDHKRTFKGCVG